MRKAKKIQVICKQKFTDKDRDRVWNSLIVLGIIPLPNEITRKNK